MLKLVTLLESVLALQNNSKSSFVTPSEKHFISTKEIANKSDILKAIKLKDLNETAAAIGPFGIYKGW